MKLLISLFFTFSLVAGNLSTIVSGGGSGGNSLTWKGYTALTYNGGTNKSTMATQCNTEYSGSHVCTYREIIKLGTSYPYSQSAWVIDGSYSTGGYQISIDGYFNNTGNSPLSPMCRGWTTSTSSYLGPYIDGIGRVWLSGCNNSYRIPCCSYE